MPCDDPARSTPYRPWVKLQGFSGTSAPLSIPVSGRSVGNPGQCPFRDVTQQPSAGTAGSPLPTQPVVAMKDSAGATLTTDKATVIALCNAGPTVHSRASG